MESDEGRVVRSLPLPSGEESVATTLSPHAAKASALPEKGSLRKVAYSPGEDIETDLDRQENPTSYEALDLDGDEETSASEWKSHTIRSGDRLSALWVDDWELPRATLYRLLEDDESARILNRLRVGQEVEWQTDDQGYLTRLRVWGDQGRGTEWRREADGWNFSHKTVENAREVSHLVITGQVESSISAALARGSDLSAGAVAALVVLLDRYLPVRARARSGDSFTLLVEQETLEGDDEPYDLRLLAFEYQGQQIDIRAARHTDDRFYTPEGKGLLPPFDRRPFDGHYRISSPFDPRRVHPVTGRVAPHRGTDFAMPSGTPIAAPADGRVTRVDKHPYAGRYLVVEHGQGYTTRYLHLSRALVRPGQMVERGDRIALSGNSGRSTGPHLHYELHVKGKAVDAMRADLPESERLAGEELRHFKRVSGTLLTQLEEADRTRRVAMAPFSEMGTM
ncbi:MAG: peptidoglycan DD-metalloendopeptidase family protein [Ectothiorhodospira sp.]